MNIFRGDFIQILPYGEVSRFYQYKIMILPSHLYIMLELQVFSATVFSNIWGAPSCMGSTCKPGALVTVILTIQDKESVELKPG